MKELKIWLNREHTSFWLIRPTMPPCEMNKRGKFERISWFTWADDIAHDIEPNHFGIQLSDV